MGGGRRSASDEGHEGEEGGGASDEGHEGKEGGRSTSDEGHEGEESGRGTGHEGYEGMSRSAVCQWQLRATFMPPLPLLVTGRRGSLGAAGPSHTTSVEVLGGIARHVAIRH